MTTSDDREALEALLGVPIPEDCELEITIKPSGEELSDDDLENVAGGRFSIRGGRLKTISPDDSAASAPAAISDRTGSASAVAGVGDAIDKAVSGSPDKKR